MIGKVWKNVRIAINFLHAKKEKNISFFVSKHNSNHKKRVILLMIPNGEKWQYLPVKILSVLLRRITSKHNADFYCLNCLHSIRTKKQTWIA